MRGKSWIRDIVSHFFILLLLGVGLYYLYTEAGEIEALASMGWLKTVFIIAFSLYALMVLIFVRQVFSSVKLERFRPGNQESLNRLDRMRRFRLPDRFAQLQRHWPEARAELRQHFIGDKWIGDNDPPFDAVMTRRRRLGQLGRPPKIDRLFIFHHPMLNVIIVDQMLKTCERVIKENYEKYPAPRNVIIFLTEMSQRDEITSAGAGVVNYLCALDRKTNLYPLLLDLDAGRLFYPLDTTLIPRRHRLYYWRVRLRIRQLIMRQIPKTRNLENKQPPLQPTAQRLRHNEEDKDKKDS